MAEDLATLRARLATYEEQCAALDTAIAMDPTNEEVLALRRELGDVVELARQLVAAKEQESATPTTAAGAAPNAPPTQGVNAAAPAAAVPAATNAGDQAPAAAAAASPSAPPVADETGFYVGQRVMAKWSDDGRWYEAKLCSRAQPEQGVPAAWLLEFEGYGNTQVTPVTELKPLAANATASGGTGSAGEAGAGAGGGASSKKQRGNAEAVDPESIKVPVIKPTDPPDVVAAKKRRIKKMRQLKGKATKEKKRRERQSSWLDFKTKGVKKGKRMRGLSKKDSIFRSPDTVDGRVGVVGSGASMTAVTGARQRWKKATISKPPPPPANPTQSSGVYTPM